MPLPTYDYRRTSTTTPDKLTAGIDAFVESIAGRVRRRQSVLTTLVEEAQEIDRMAPDWTHVSDRVLRDRLAEYQRIFRRNRHGWETCRGQAVAAIREAAERQLGLRPYVVQLLGTLVLHKGYLAEMATGEGKTLVAGLAAVLAGWTKRPCHIITVNDYLAQRDAEWLKPLYDFCGVSVGFITGQSKPAERFTAHDQDITYTTSKEIVADFLRDRLHMGTIHDPPRRHIRSLLQGQARNSHGLVMRGLDTAIVDEADSVLIDEAVTPLIISRQQENNDLKDSTTIANRIAEKLKKDRDYKVVLRYKEIEITDSGHAIIDALCEQLPGIWRGPNRREELITQALTAREFFHEGKQYVIQDDHVVIVDESTGRIMPQRTWRQGLHQAIEAKENLEISNPSETLARLSFQRFFRLFRRLSGMTGTAHEAASEFWHIYRLPVIKIPTNRPSQRRQLDNRIFADQDSKRDAIAEEIVKLHNQGLPILVGTRNVTASELLAAKLRERGLEPALLNAVHHQEEAQIIAQAGLKNRITIATNMAGRGTDIKLEKGIAERGGLQVILTERHESYRIDRQFYGRCARQGDPGCVQTFISVDDELINRFIPKVIRENLAVCVTKRYPGYRQEAVVALKLAQRIARRVAYRQRSQVLKMDTWIDEALSFTGSTSV